MADPRRVTRNHRANADSHFLRESASRSANGQLVRCRRASPPTVKIDILHGVIAERSTAVITGGAQGLKLAIGHSLPRVHGLRLVMNLEATEVAAKRLGGDDVARRCGAM